MAYNGKTNWQLNEIVKPEDMNRIEQGIIDAYESLLTHNASADAHKNRFDEFVKGVTGSNATLTITKGNGTTSSVTVNNVANATNATNATKATQDSTGQQINTTYIKGLSISGRNITYTKGNGTTGTITTQDTTYNFGGTTFYSGNQNTAEHNANNCLKNGHYYYTSNGPSTSVGASTDDGGLYTQSYNDSWVGQIAQDYRNGRLFVRGKNNETWTSWLALLDSSNYNNYSPTKTGGGASGTWGINVTGKANTAGTADIAKKVYGSYSGNGGQQGPAYFGRNSAGFLMSNANVNSDTNYKNWLYMDNYNENDVGGATAFGVSRVAPRAFLMQSDANRSSWNNSAELLSTYNYNTYAPKKDGTGASGTWGINISGNANTATKATQDSAGQQINMTYIKGLSISGNTITYTKGNGGTGSITVPTGAGANAYITESKYNSDGSWYRKWSDRWLEQGGVVSATNASAFQIISLLKAFNNPNYQVMITHIITENTPPGNASTSCIATKTTTNFKVNRNQKYLSAIQWVACGKA